MKINKIKLLSVFVLSIVSSACTSTSLIPFPKFFNTNAFVGFVSMSDGRGRVLMDYELDGSNGKVVLFKSCDDVKQTLETDIVTHQYYLWQLIQINCKAIVEFNNASVSTQSYWPSGFDREFIANLPATAIPNLGGNTLEGREGLLKDVERELEINPINTNSIEVILSGDLAITYTVMARGDFDHDGSEDILLRLDWSILTAFGKGFSLLLLSNPRDSTDVKIVWRDG